ncbi:MAG: ligase [Oscillochloridaceae bacterium]|nr:ligase [Chloroflexaceae bacterium]MDW8390887.1 ligase [Oscillochloridaceae bacterium]
MSRAPATSWRFLPYSEDPPEVELARAEALLAGLAQLPRPALRWYGARRPALVIGSGQRLADVDESVLAATGITLHRRASGGAAVLFTPGFLMQDIALPAEHPLHQQDVSESYRWLGEAWVATLGEFGIAARLVSIPEARADAHILDPLARLACFGGRSPYEVLVGERKVAGFSQIRRRPGALLQAGLYTCWPGRELAALLRLPPAGRERLATLLEGRAAGLADLLPEPPLPERIIAAFGRVLANQHGVSLAPADWREDELALAAAAQARFAPIT